METKENSVRVGVVYFPGHITLVWDVGFTFCLWYGYFFFNIVYSTIAVKSKALSFVYYRNILYHIICNYYKYI